MEEPMRNASKHALIGTAISLLFVSAAHAESIMGSWSRGDGQVKIRMAPCGGAICATNTWIKEGNTSDKLGGKLIFNVKQNGSGYSGTAYDPERKLKMSAKINVAGDTMTSQGCVLGGVACKSMNWTRIR
jgi:uncharacterized protein (DUF2147 family)